MSDEGNPQDWSGVPLADIEDREIRWEEACRRSKEGEISDEDARSFWEEARWRAGEGKCNFSEVTFPDDPGQFGFSRARFEEAADFTRVEFQGDADFSLANLVYGACFDEATFCGTACFIGTRFRKDVSFVSTEFRGFAQFNNADFQGNAHFLDSTMSKDVDFSNACSSGVMDFSVVEFLRNVEFRFEKFPESVSLVFANCGGRFVVPPSVVFKKPGDLASVFRLAKQTAQNHGDYRAAGDYHYLEQRAINTKNLREGRWSWRFWGALAEWFFGRLIFGYGEKPMRPLVWAGIVIVACAILYALGGVMHGNGILNHDFLNALYFSTVTFTTLGYGDLQPPPGWVSTVAALEALAGAALMALFIVSLARKFTR